MLLGNGFGFWKTMPMRGAPRPDRCRRRRGRAVVADLPSMRARTTRSFMRLRLRRSVLLPHPDGPMMAVMVFRHLEADVADGSEGAVEAGRADGARRRLGRRRTPLPLAGPPLCAAGRDLLSGASSERWVIRSRIPVGPRLGSCSTIGLGFGCWTRVTSGITTFGHIDSAAGLPPALTSRMTTSRTTMAAAV